MDDLIDGIIDSVVDGVSSIIENADVIIDSASDIIGDVSEDAINALTEGNFNEMDFDFSSLFDSGEIVDSQIIETTGLNGIDIDFFKEVDTPSSIPHEDTSECIGEFHESNNNTNNGSLISFCGSYDMEKRDKAKSLLIDKLQEYYIYYSNIYSDNVWGGLDEYSGRIIKDSIDRARNNSQISNSVYNELMRLLKEACHSI